MGWDTILLDAPCSATGMIRKYPELKWRLRENDLPRLCQTQRALLDSAAEAVAPSGRIVYVTCSLEPEENEAQVESFLTRWPAFQRRRFQDLAAPPGAESFLKAFVSTAGDLRLLPGDTHMGMFAAILERTDPP